MDIKFWFFQNSQNIRNKYDKKLEWIWRPLLKRLFQFSNICIVKVYFFQTSITSTIPQILDELDRISANLVRLIGKFGRFLGFQFLRYKTSSNQNSTELYRILWNSTGLLGSDFFVTIEFWNAAQQRCSAAISGALLVLVEMLVKGCQSFAWVWIVAGGSR
jgi:hypothetical protein